MTEATRYGMGWVTSSRSMRERGTMMSATMPSDGQRAPDHLVGLGIQQGAFVGGFQDGLDAFAVLGLSAHEGKQAVHQRLRVLRCEQASRREQVSMTEATRYGMGWVTSSRSMRERGTMMSATMPSDTRVRGRLPGRP